MHKLPLAYSSAFLDRYRVVHSFSTQKCTRHRRTAMRERVSAVESSAMEGASPNFHFLFHPGGPPETGFGSWQECSQHCHAVCCLEFTYLHLASLLCANDCPGLAPILQQLQFFFDGGETCNKKRGRERERARGMGPLQIEGGGRKRDRTLSTRDKKVAHAS